jgi:hypothetical protein
MMSIRSSASGRRGANRIRKFAAPVAMARLRWCEQVRRRAALRPASRPPSNLRACLVSLHLPDSDIRSARAKLSGAHDTRGASGVVRDRADNRVVHRRLVFAAVALALAGAARAYPQESPPVVAPAPLPDYASHQRRLRLTRNVALAATAVTLAGVVIGAPLLAVGDPRGPQPRNGYVGAGYALLALSGVSLVTTVVSFALWLRERHRAPPNVAVSY